jgi:hypothetical protein
MTNQLSAKSVRTVQSLRCRYIGKGGGGCKANAQTGTEFCFFHDPELDEERAAARQAGGIARTRKIVLPADLSVKRLQTVAEVVDLLGETINQVRRGELDLRVSNAIGYLAGILLSAIEKSSFEERLAALETAVATPSQSTQLPFEQDDSFDFVQPHMADPSCSNKND